MSEGNEGGVQRADASEVQRTVRRVPNCSFCGSAAPDLEVLLEGKSGALICSQCVEGAMLGVANYRRDRGWGIQPPPGRSA